MVQKDSFSFAGVDMRARFGILCVTHDVLLPTLRRRLLVVSQRDGSHDFGARWYEDRVVRITCDSLRPLSREALRELAHILSRKGRLVLWDEPDKHYIARLYDDTQLQYIGRIGHAFELVFVCEPFAVGETVIKNGLGKTDYRGTARTPTRLVLKNGGSTHIKRLRMTVTRVDD